jgi:thioredoxin-related protein/YHS domain-containing protein
MPLALFACLAVALANSSVAQDRIPWVTDLKVARQMAEQQQRLVLLHFWSETCGPCQKLERTVFNQPEFIRAISSAFIPVKINAQQSQDLAKYYQITAIPTDVVVDPTGKEVFRGTSPQNAAAYIAVLDGIRARNNIAQQAPGDLIASTSQMLQSPWGQPQNAAGGNNAAPPALIGAAEQPASETPAAAPQEPSRTAPVESPYANANPSPNANPLYRSAPDATVNNFAPRYSNQSAASQATTAPATEPSAPAAQPASRFGQLAAPAALAAAAASQFGQPATQAASQFAQDTNQAASQFSQTASQATQAASQFAQNTTQASQSASQFGQNAAQAAKSASQFLQNPTQAVSQFEQNTTQAAQAASQFAQNTTQASQSATQFAQPVAQAASKFGPNAAQAASQFEQKTSQTAQAVSQFGQNAAQAASQFAQGTTQAASQFTAPAATPAPPASRFQGSAAEAPQVPGDNFANAPAPPLADNFSQPQAPAANSMNRAPAPMSQPWDAGRNNAPAANADPQAGLRPSQPNMAAPVGGQPQLALDGFCSVSLVEQSKWTKGDPRWGAVHKGRVYLFGSAQAQQQFMSNPDRYSPMLAGNDIVRFADSGQAVEGKREHGVYYRDHILLFSDEESLQRFGSRPDYYLAAAEQAAPGQSASPVR